MSGIIQICSSFDEALDEGLQVTLIAFAECRENEMKGSFQTMHSRHLAHNPIGEQPTTR